MLYLIVLVTLLIVLAGIIAYAGDKLGTYIGRRRLSLFGWRPKRTGQVIGIVGGIIIMLVTLGTLAVAFRGATSVLVRAQQTAEELTHLRAEQRLLEGNIDSLQQQITDRTEELASAQEIIADARAQHGEALAERDRALAERDALREEQAALTRHVSALQEQIAELDASLAQSEDALAYTQNQLAQVDEELASALEEREAAIRELTRALIEASEARVEADRLRDEVEGTRQELEAAHGELGDLQALLETSRGQLAEAREGREQAEAQRRQAVLDRDQALNQARAADAQARSLQSAREGLERQLASLELEIAELEDRAASLAEQNVELVSHNEELQASNQALLADNERLVSDNHALREQNDELLGSIYTLNDQVTSLNDTIGELQAQVDRQARELAATQEQFATLSADTLTFRANEIVHSAVVSNSDEADIFVQLEELVRDANRRAAERGAGPIELSSVQVSSLVQAIKESPGDDLVVLYSPENQFEGADLKVEVDAFENSRLLAAGQLITSRHVHLGNDGNAKTQEEIRAELTNLTEEAGDRLQRLGLFEGVRPLPAPEGLSEDGFVARLSTLSGPVVIGLVAAEAVYKGGPAHLEFVIVR